jgi:hypothetical protein
MNPISYSFVENGTTRMLKPRVMRRDRPKLSIILTCKLLIMNRLTNGREDLFNIKKGRFGG